MIKKLAEVDIFSDGWANPNPGPGWYGVRFKKLKTRSKVTLHTDSQYTINGLQKWWAQKWRSNNWLKADKKKAQNWDLWEILLQEYEKHEVSFNWIKGHNGHIENELCDELLTVKNAKIH